VSFTGVIMMFPADAKSGLPVWRCQQHPGLPASHVHSALLPPSAVQAGSMSVMFCFDTAGISTLLRYV